MMDEDKLKGEQEMKSDESAEVTHVDADAADEAKSAEVLDAKTDADEALQEAETIISDAVNNLKLAFDEIKQQLAPVRESLREVAGAIKEGVEEARIAATEMAAAPESDDKKDDAHDGEPKENVDETPKDDDAKQDDSVASRMSDDALNAAREASELLATGVEKLRERAANMKFDLKEVISKEFERFADEKLSDGDYELDENGKRVVKIDGKFVQDHANEVVPALLRGAVSSLFSAFLGKTPENAENKENTEPADENANADEVHDSKYRVKFDFSNDLGDAIRSAKASTQDAEATEHDREVGREIIIESARILEDGLNGNPVENVDERLENAAKRADIDEADKAPEDIEVIDEKHRKILEMTREFEKNMNKDDE